MQWLTTDESVGSLGHCIALFLAPKVNEFARPVGTGVRTLI